MWTTLDDTPTHLVQWGTDAANLTSTSANGTSSTYTHFGWVGHLHRARMIGLAPGQQYFYSVGADGGTCVRACTHACERVRSAAHLHFAGMWATG